MKFDGEARAGNHPFRHVADVTEHKRAAPDVQSDPVFRHLPDRPVGAQHGFERDAFLRIAEFHQAQFLDRHAFDPVGRVGREVEGPEQHAEVVLAYTPISGGSVSAPVGNFVSDPDHGDEWADEARRRYCIEPALETEMNRRRLIGAEPGDRHYGSSDVGYVLSTGANWRGLIGRFRLIVETPADTDFVFLCFDGARRVAANRIEAELTDFWPWQDLDILFVRLWVHDQTGED